MKQAIVFCLLTLVGVDLVAASAHLCPTNEEFRAYGGPACENCGPRCLAWISAPKCYCKSGYSRVYGNCIPDGECFLYQNKHLHPSQQTQRNPMENLGMYDGDILGIESDEDRNAVANKYKLWPGGVLPYVIDDNIRSIYLNATLQAMKYIEERTCIKFIQRTDERDYVRIIHGDGCYSHWGRIGREQLLSIGKGCGNIGTAMHELLHAVGFEHEHRRSDRDNYVIILLQNVKPKQEHNFKKLRPSQNRLLTPFDYDSIMLYGSSTFAKSPGLSTIIKMNREKLQPVYRKKDMSESDVQRVKLLYECPD